MKSTTRDRKRLPFYQNSTFDSGENTRLFGDIYELIKDELLFISIIQIGEISDWCLKNEINPTERISNLKDIVNLIPLSEKYVLKAQK